MNYLTTLKDLRKEKGISQETIANELHISQKAYSYYERGEREPSIKTLIDIADFFNVTIDYILGRETKKFYSLENEERNIIDKYKKLNNVNKAKIEERIDTFIDCQSEEEVKARDTA